MRLRSTRVNERGWRSQESAAASRNKAARGGLLYVFVGSRAFYSQTVTFNIRGLPRRRFHGSLRVGWRMQPHEQQDQEPDSPKPKKRDTQAKWLLFAIAILSA